MLVRVSERRFLVDAPIRDGIAPYATSGADERRRLEAAEPPYDRIDAILVTHWHEDHFSAEAIAAHLARDVRTIVVSSPEVIDRLRRAAPDLPAARLRAVLPKAGTSETVDVAGVPVHVLRVRHNPARRLPEEHVGFLIGDAAPVLHVGDADPAADNFTALRRLPAPDVALLPFWYVTEAQGRAMVQSAIRPRRVVAMHAPPAEAGRIAPQLSGGPFGIVLASTPGGEVTLAP
jgi:L-ascorbate metabolism protein UlaG (beta-lactamase superfamily)